MNSQVSGRRHVGPGIARFAVWGATLFAASCAAAAPSLPEPRPIIIYSGARIRADSDRLEAINEWVNREQTNIVEDPGFWVIPEPAVEEVYPWEGLTIRRDSVWVRVDPRASDTRVVHEIYGHLHLMAAMGRQEEWLPEAPTATGYELERAILARVSDAWLLGRTVFGTSPYGPLDELLYANEAGFLDPFIFTARPDEFGEARARWARENPGKAEEYRSWFLETFNREPPGLRAR
ncbi:MAG: hypothetical protein P8170_01325 [Gemmatimonadota bacterium]|jgi:hypothetical protein